MSRPHPHRSSSGRTVNRADYQELWHLVNAIEMLLYGDPLEQPPVFPAEGLPPRVEAALIDITAPGPLPPEQAVEAAMLREALNNVIQRLRTQSRGS